MHNFKEIIENKKTNGQPWREKDVAWSTLTELFNSQIPKSYSRSKEALKKYNNIKKSVRKKVAEDRREILKTGGGHYEIKTDAAKELTLGLMNIKNVYGLHNNFDSAAVVECEENEDLGYKNAN